jgi:hypothetical protein
MGWSCSNYGGEDWCISAQIFLVSLCLSISECLYGSQDSKHASHVAPPPPATPPVLIKLVPQFMFVYVYITTTAGRQPNFSK